jgi:adenosylcobinamide-GDP ribazoletransferase
VLGILILAIGLGPMLGIAALILLLVAIVLMAWLSVVQIDGQTGDVLGAVEQVSEILILLVALR